MIHTMRRLPTVFPAFLFTIVLLGFIVFPVHAQTASLTPSITARPVNAGGCKAVETVITRRTEALPKLAENIMNKFSAHASRVDEYYTGSLLPAGYIVPNYNELMAQVTAKKLAVETAINQARTDGAVFTCGSNPKGTMTTFRKDMLSVISALKEYKLSVRNLIQAVAKVIPDTQ